MTEPWGTYDPIMNATRMEIGVGPELAMASSVALIALAASFEIQEGVLLANTASMDLLWPGLTVAARQAKITAYSEWLQEMFAECMRMASACVLVAESYAETLGLMVPSAEGIRNRINQAIAVATNFCGFNEPIITFLDTTFVEYWLQNATQMSVYDAKVITASAPVPKRPPPLLVNPAEPALDAAQQAVTSMAQNTPGSVANQQMADPSKLMDSVQGALSAPQQMGSQLMQPFQSGMSAPQQFMQQFMSAMNGGMGGNSMGGAENMGYSPFAAVGGGGGSSPTLSGGGMGGFASGSGGVGGLRAPLGAPASSGGGLTAMSNTQSLSGGSKTVVPAASSAAPGMGGGLGGAAGMRGKEETTRAQPLEIEAGVAPIVDNDTVRANEIVAQWLPKRTAKID